MARKKELMELENPSMEGNTPVETADIEAGIFPGEEDGTPSETDGDGMDLNELLGSMDQEPSDTPDPAEGELPELTEEEMFGETPEDAAVSGEAQPEAMSSPETENPPAKARRTARRKKEETSEGPAGEAQDTDAGKTDLPETAPDSVLPSQDTAEEADGTEKTIPQEDMESTGTEDTALSSGEDV